MFRKTIAALAFDVRTLPALAFWRTMTLAMTGVCWVAGVE
jgi:hypothetical protein